MRKALIVGINAYPRNPLYGCINDANEVAKIIETNGDETPNFDVRMELNVFSKSVLRGLLIELFAGINDTVLLYFSGHGYVSELGGYIGTPDGRQFDEGVRLDEILYLANDSKAKSKIIILDCCYSGVIGQPELLGNGPSIINDGLSILSACNEKASEINGHGIFTSLLLEGLQGGAADLSGNITVGNIYSYVDQALGPWDQRPVFKTNISIPPLLRKVRSQLSLSELRKLTDLFPKPDSQASLDRSNLLTTENIVDQIDGNTQNIIRQYIALNLITEESIASAECESNISRKFTLTSLGHHYWRLIKTKKLR